MKYNVFYRTKDEVRSSYLVTPENINPVHYYKVAEGIECANLEHLFRRMNLVDASEEELVGRGPGKLPIRSMSVGDVAVDDNGQAYLCGTVGWQVIEHFDFK